MIEEPLQKYSRSTLDVLYSLIVSLSLKNKISHKKVFVVLFEDTNVTLSVSLHTLSVFVYLSPSRKMKYTLFRVYASSPSQLETYIRDKVYTFVTV